MIKQTECGICPKCENGDLNYGKEEVEATSMAYPFTCNNCGLKGYEVYGIEFSHMATEEGKMFEEKSGQE